MYLMKMVQKIKPRRGEVNGANEGSEIFVGVGEDHAMSFDVKDVSDLTIQGFDLDAQEKLQNGRCLADPVARQGSLTQPGSTAGLRTDADISGNLAFRERQLQRWAPSADTDVDLTLESSVSGGEWDQFKANEKLFGLKSDYDENIYTTTIDRSNPSYRVREARAQRLAQEIEGMSTSSSHILEERGVIDEDGGLDEEDK